MWQHYYVFLFYALVFMCYMVTIVMVVIRELLQPFTSDLIGIPPHFYVTKGLRFTLAQIQPLPLTDPINQQVALQQKTTLVPDVPPSFGRRQDLFHRPCTQGVC